MHQPHSFLRVVPFIPLNLRGHRAEQGFGPGCTGTIWPLSFCTCGRALTWGGGGGIRRPVHCRRSRLGKAAPFRQTPGAPPEPSAPGTWSVVVRHPVCSRKWPPRTWSSRKKPGKGTFVCSAISQIAILRLFLLLCLLLCFPRKKSPRKELKIFWEKTTKENRRLIKLALFVFLSLSRPFGRAHKD